jgi:UDP-N-acetylmuramoylalanine--D-glutamate ligase
MRQTPDDSAVLNQHDEQVARWQPYARGRVIGAVEMREVPALKLPGDHNRINAACAMAAARAVGCHRAAELRGLIGFGGLASRLDRVATIGGISLYDDSAATTPESTRAALEALNTPTWMLIGGKDKGLDLGNLAAELVRRARGAAFYGAAADTLSGSCRAIDARFNHAMVATLDAALHWCWQQAEPGDAIVLSPACSSHDQFTNYRARSEHFRAAVRVLADRYNR